MPSNICCVSDPGLIYGPHEAPLVREGDPSAAGNSNFEVLGNGISQASALTTSSRVIMSLFLIN